SEFGKVSEQTALRLHIGNANPTVRTRKHEVCHAASPCQTSVHPSGSDCRVDQRGAGTSRRTPARSRSRNAAQENTAGRNGAALGELGQFAGTTAAEIRSPQYPNRGS